MLHASQLKKKISSILGPTLLCGLLTTQAQALTFNVTKTVDEVDMAGCTEDDCSLREAISAANSTDPTPDPANIIVLPAADQDYVLTIEGKGENDNEEGDLDIILFDLIIEGAGADVTIINAGKIDRAFHVLNVPEGVPAPNVTFRNLSITGGEPEEAASGGGILVDTLSSDLTIENCAVYGNNVVNPGALGGGGGLAFILATDEANVAISGSTFSHNSASSSSGGGAFFAVPGTFDLFDIKITNSTFSENGARNGGAIALYNPLESNADLNLTLSHVTATKNTAGNQGGGLLASGLSAANVSYFNSIISGNEAVSSGDDCSIIDLGQIQSTNDFSIVGSKVDCGASAGNLDTNPQLGILTHNGGPTQTHALLSQSPAINFVPNAACVDANQQPLTLDQRGITRPQQTACDSGAYEANCGDGIRQGTEQCDDGNDIAEDGCEADCTLNADIVCGNGVVDEGEACDDGNILNFDGCNEFCELEFLEGSGSVLGCSLNAKSAANVFAWAPMLAIALALSLRKKQQA